MYITFDKAEQTLTPIQVFISLVLSFHIFLTDIITISLTQPLSLPCSLCFRFVSLSLSRIIQRLVHVYPQWVSCLANKRVSQGEIQVWLRDK